MSPHPFNCFAQLEYASEIKMFRTVTNDVYSIDFTLNALKLAGLMTNKQMNVAVFVLISSDYLGICLLFNFTIALL